ncbi:GvpL/GvpF family gas vesicle protein [Glycomyces luteolus]|uniref:GvpL/GvpF family gas vesicle protein n=1 Tax=Glycomyces luteolus TaxID=2670330 RepID=A0A9X3T468_9ACTN|nr:GvpL/GvpF family gas vesicle protein [Glycomyces luteolus]MDA1360715.1 GvpL/GvpF family gas vesicle protein [Glycomyces luteolus]
MPGSGVWLYAVSSRLVSEAGLAGTTGVDAERLRTVERDGLVAVVGSVDLDEFGEAPLRRKLDHLETLEAIARAHHAVVDAAARLAPVVPIRLATVYRGDDGIADLLAQRHDELTTALERISGRFEWGVKAYAAPASPAEPDAEATSDAGPGTAYLLRRRTQLETLDRARQTAVDSAEHVHARLSEIAVASRRHAPQDAQLTGTPEWMVLNGAYLVDVTRADEFAHAVDSLKAAQPTVRLELTGPWPPYSFTAGEPAEADDAAQEAEART